MAEFDLPTPPDDILLVEDNYIIALDMEDMLHKLGVARVRTAKSVVQALDMIAEQNPQFAFIDVDLVAEKGFAVAERLREMGVPFVFATGYGDSYAFPPEFADASIVGKPYSFESIRSAIFRAPGAGATAQKRPPPEPEGDAVT